MTFIDTVDEAEATGDVAAMYEADRDADGRVPNYAKAFSRRPEVYSAWKALNKAVVGGMDARRYELVSVAAARRLRSSYCALAHGSRLVAQGLMESDDLAAGTDLDPVEVEIMALADKVAGDASSVTEQDVDRLRDLGLDDTEVFDVVAAAAMRAFFAKTLDGLGAQPDAKYAALDPNLRAALTVGRPIADDA
jgi:uncharacterized peroxidase-related enzyme